MAIEEFKNRNDAGEVKEDDGPSIKKLVDEFGVGILFFLLSLVDKSREKELREKNGNNSTE